MQTGRWRRLIRAASVRKAAAAVLILLILYTVAGFFILPPVLKSVLKNKLSQQLHREVNIQRVEINPFTLSATVKGLNVKERNSAGTFLSFDNLHVNLQAASIIKRALVIKEIKLTGPYLNIRRDVDGIYNFSDLLAGKPEAAKKPAASGGLQFSVNNIQIINGSADFFDRVKDVHNTIRGANVTIPFISNIAHYVDAYVKPSFSAIVNNERVSFEGETKPFANSLETSINLHIKNLDLTHYLAYAPFKMKFKIPSGFFNMDTHISYVQYKDRPPFLGISGGLSLKDLKFEDSNGNPVANFPLIGASIISSDLFSKTAHLADLVLSSPEVDVVRGRDGKMNLMEMLPESGGAKPEQKEKAPLPLINADSIAIKEGALDFTDLASGKKFTTRIDGLNMKISHFTTATGKKSALELALKTEAGESLGVKSDLFVSPFAANGQFEIKNLVLKKYAPYYGKMVRFDIEDGKLGLASGFSYDGDEKHGAENLSGMSVNLSGLKLRKRDEKKDFLSVPVFIVNGADIDLLNRKIGVAEVKTEKATLIASRQKNGAMNITGLMAPAPTGRGAQRRRKGASAQKWLFNLKKFSADNYRVNFEDMMPAVPVKYVITRINLRGENMSTARGSKANIFLSCMPGGKGSFKARAIVGTNPAAVSARLDLKGLEIIPFQPYFTNNVKILVTSGNISGRGELRLRYPGGKLAASYKGEASLSEFASLDKGKGDQFLKWDSLHFGGLAVSSNPMNVQIDRIALSNFYSRVIIEKNGFINLQGIFNSTGGGSAAPQSAKAASSPAQTPATAASKMVKINTVTLQGGTINFTDRHIEPNYSANLTEIGGRVSGMSSIENTAADVDLIGKLDNYAPLEITGKVNPLQKNLFVDLKMDFKDMDMSTLTPYSGRHIGYTIQKGKLFLSMQYLIANNKLDAQNHVFLDQLALGDKVESPVATKLPVRLAIALLKDRNGQINLDVPVSGYINDPKFSLGGVIWKVIKNILVKAATAPFALLSSIFGHGADLSYVEFNPGMAVINAPEAKKLDAVEKALFDRPGLRLDIEGRADLAQDRGGLRQYIFNREIKYQKWKETAAKGGKAVSVDEVTVSKEEYPKYLKLAYKAAKFPKPRNFLGIAKSLPVPEMEKLMLTNIRITDNELTELASRRAKAVKDYILKSGSIDPKRVFLLANQLGPGEKGQPGNRAELKLK